ncbi:MAG: glycoside hydrolase family 2 protein, partial [Chlorobi bacterium]|nr:glycoside hydrolase family 2 protein [Chlorobiota bacterium]
LGVWHGEEPFEEFKKPAKIGRFMSEYGFQSLPEMSSIKKFTFPEDRDIHSKVMLTHQKHRIGYPVIDKYMKWYYRFPKDFEAYLYVSQVMQSFGMDMAIEAHRRAMPECMGTLYWQLNDCYPVASWSSVDYYGKWKALHYRVRDIYKEILVSPEIEKGLLNVYGVSDALKPVTAMLDLALYDFTGKLLKEKKKQIEIMPNSGKVYYSESVNQFIGGHSKNDLVLVAKVTRDKEQLAENHFFFVYPKDLKLQKNKINFTTRKLEKGYELTFTSDVFAKEVFLSTDDGKGFFTNNFFDLIPGQPVKTVFLIDKDIPDVKKTIKVYSLVDAY